MAFPIDLSPQLIGSPATGVNLYQVPNASMLVLQDILNETWAQGIANKQEFATKIATALSGFLNITNTPSVTAGMVSGATVTEPGVTIPATAAASDVYTDFAARYLELATWIDGKRTSFLSTHFPNEAALYAAGEASLSAALANDSYLPAATQQQIWGDDHARITADKQRAQDSVVAQFAARRFPLPPDVAASAVLQIEQKAQDALAESSRKIAVLSVEQYRYVIGKVQEFRDTAMDSALKYITAMFSGPDMASRLVGVGYDAQSKLISAASSFYNARIEAAKLTNDVAKYNNSTQLEADVKNQMAELTMIEDKLKAMLAEAQSVAQMATAMFNNLNASVSMTAGGTSIATQAQDMTV